MTDSCETIDRGTGVVENVKILLGGKTVDIQDNVGWMELMSACRDDIVTNNGEAVKMLIKLGEECNPSYDERHDIACV